MTRGVNNLAFWQVRNRTRKRAHFFADRHNLRRNPAY